MSRNEREAVAFTWANRKRLNDAGAAEAGGKPVELFLVHVGPGVKPSSTSIFEIGMRGVFTSVICLLPWPRPRALREPVTRSRTRTRAIIGGVQAPATGGAAIANFPLQRAAVERADCRGADTRVSPS
jgi:hypothetical protein